MIMHLGNYVRGRLADLADNTVRIGARDSTTSDVQFMRVKRRM